MAAIVSVTPVAFWPETILRVLFDGEFVAESLPTAITASTYSLERGANGEHHVSVRSALQGAPDAIDIYCFGIPNGAYTLSTTEDIVLESGTLAAGTSAALLAYGQPIDRVVILTEMIPEIHWSQDTTGDLRRFVEQVMQPIVDELYNYSDRWADIIDPDLAPENVLDLMLQDMGNPFPFILDVQRKRALVQSLTNMYRTVGTKNGLEAAIRFFVGLEATVVPVYKTGWKLGTSRLNQDTVLGSTAILYTFDIIVYEPLNDFEESAITWLANYLKVSHEHFRKITVDEDSMATISTITPYSSTVTTTAAKFVNTNTSRKWLYIQNNGTDDIYVGFDTAPSATGMIIAPGAYHEWDTAVPTTSIYYKAASGSQDVRTQEGV